MSENSNRNDKYALFERSECFRTGTNGEINTSEAIKLLKSDELRELDVAAVTLEILETFGQTYISESLFRAVRSFVLFRIRSKKFTDSFVPYNMIIETDSETDITFIAKCIYKILSSFSEKEIESKQIKSENIIDAAAKFSPDADMFFISGITDSFLKETDKIRALFDKTPHTAKILFLSSELASKLREENPSFYYQTMGHLADNHPSAISFIDTDIYSAFMRKITEKHTVKSGFSVGIKEYIETVYPSADLQNGEFIDDLIRRVESQMLTTPILTEDDKGIIITEEGIPFSLKVEEKKNAQKKNSESKPDEIVYSELYEIEEAHTTKKAKYGKERKNILLLNLSTFGQKLSKNEYYCDWNSDLKYYGFYQLDPIPKMLSDVLSKKEECLDEIIMLATDKTLEKQNIEMITGEHISKHINCSPEDFFKTQVKNYLNPEIPDEEKFHTIKIENVDNPSVEIKEAVEYIRKADAKLFIDAHGSLRGLTLASLAINSLLLNESKGAKKVYSIELNRNAPSRIFEDTADNLFDFVSGINEFRSFGRIDSLEKYLRGNAKELTKPMKAAAEAISVCDINKFDKAIKEIKLYFANRRSNTEVSAENYLAIFENTIENDYGELIKDDSTVIDMIEWCFKKKLYQAALTIAESKIPEYIFGKVDSDDYTEAELPLYRISGLDDTIRIWNEAPHGKKENSFATWILNQIVFQFRGREVRSSFLKENYDKHLADDAETIESAYGTINPRFNEKEVKEFILLLKKLKGTRNDINHCKDNIVETEVIDKALKDFIERFKKLKEVK